MILRDFVGLDYIINLEHSSWSNFRKYMSSQLDWKMGYVEHIWYPASPNMIIGKALHAGINKFFEKNNVEDAMRKIADEVDASSDVAWTKSVPDKLKALKVAENAFTFFLEELPEYEQVIESEEMFVTEVKHFTKDLSVVPVKGAIDNFFVQDKKYIIEDYKTVTAFTDVTGGFSTAHIMQGMTYKKAVEARYGFKADQVLITEIKTSKNRDGSPQLRHNFYEFTKEDEIVWDILFMQYIVGIVTNQIFDFPSFPMNNPNRDHEEYKYVTEGCLRYNGTDKFKQMVEVYREIGRERKAHLKNMAITD